MPTKFVEAHRVVSPKLALQTQKDLHADAGNLSQFLQTLQGRDQERYDEIQRFVTSAFPELKYVNPESENNEVLITLTFTKDGRKVPLTHSGTGVEQMLTLATFVLTSPQGTLILLDEPHSYLHPTAERRLMSFLEDHDEHRYFIATHSPIIINCVPAEKINYLTPPIQKETAPRFSTAAGEVMKDLGYRNSDFLFNDRIIFVEGESDQAIYPLLLKRSGRFSLADVERTGFPTLNGKGKLEGKRRCKERQLAILWYEKFLGALGRASIQRIYLLGGDWPAELRAQLQKTTNPVTGQTILVRFLKRCEVENYLLQPEAIATAINKQALVENLEIVEAKAEDIRKLLRDITGPENQGSQQNEKNNGLLEELKGSAVLERLFSKHNMVYDKKRSGALIAENLNMENHPVIREVCDLVSEVFALNND